MRAFVFIWLSWGVFGSALAQDSLSRGASSLPLPAARAIVDSFPNGRLADSLRQRLDDFPFMPAGCRSYGDAIGGYVEAHPYFPWLTSPEYLISRERGDSGMDWLFYTLFASLTFFGLLRRGFARYMADLAIAFFDQAIRQAQIREQLARQALPGQLLNLQFFFSTALFAHLMAPDLRLPGLSGHGSQIGGFMLLTAAVYAVKSVTVWTAGYLSGKPTEAEGYLFIVMMVNKMAGIALIPMNILLAYLGRDFSAMIAGIVLLLLSVLFLYRFVRCFEYVNREFRIGVLPFLLFLASFEVMPVLVVAKLLLGVFSREMH